VDRIGTRLASDARIPGLAFHCERGLLDALRATDGQPRADGLKAGSR
jgi:hypothetical protein